MRTFSFDAHSRDCDRESYRHHGRDHIALCQSHSFRNIARRKSGATYLPLCRLKYSRALGLRRSNSKSPASTILNTCISVHTTNGSQTSLLVDFYLHTDPNMISSLPVRHSFGTRSLPPEVLANGNHVCESRTAPFLLLACTAPRHRPRVSVLTATHLNAPIGRPMAWAGRRSPLGAGQYAMRLWIKPINWLSWASP